MTTSAAVAARVRMELGDTGKSFVHSFVGDGVTTRFDTPYAPMDGATLVVMQNGVDISHAVEVEEPTGVLTFDVAPPVDSVVVIAGTVYRFFTNAEVAQIVTETVPMHLGKRVTAMGSTLTLANLDPAEDYPLALLATINALYVLATDASFDIDINAPDGVSIPRAERYRQTLETISALTEQYRTLCSLMGIGMYAIEVFTLRRISRKTNRYVPVYLPQEVDDRSYPQRAWLPLPTYGAVPIPEPAYVTEQDIELYQGDDYIELFVFPNNAVDLSTSTVKAQIRAYPASPQISATFTVVVVDVGPAGPTASVYLSLTSAQTTNLPLQAFYDVQVTDQSGGVKTYFRGHAFTQREVTV